MPFDKNFSISKHEIFFTREYLESFGTLVANAVQETVFRIRIFETMFNW